MSTLEAPAVATTFPTGLAHHRFTVEQYHEMVEKGILTKDDRVELLEGLILKMTPINGPHCYTVEELYDALKPMLPAGWKISSQRPITLAESEPQPDISIVRGTKADFKNRHAGPSEIGLVIEVADSSLASDRLVKTQLYAAAGVPEYWIVSLAERQIEVYRTPRPDRRTAGYESRQVFAATDKVPVTIAGRLLGEFVVESVLP